MVFFFCSFFCCFFCSFFFCVYLFPIVKPFRRLVVMMESLPLRGEGPRGLIKSYQKRQEQETHRSVRLISTNRLLRSRNEQGDYGKGTRTTAAIQPLTLCFITFLKSFRFNNNHLVYVLIPFIKIVWAAVCRYVLERTVVIVHNHGLNC